MTWHLEVEQIIWMDNNLVEKDGISKTSSRFKSEVRCILSPSKGETLSTISKSNVCIFSKHRKCWEKMIVSFHMICYTWINEPIRIKGWITNRYTCNAWETDDTTDSPWAILRGLITNKYTCNAWEADDTTNSPWAILRSCSKPSWDKVLFDAPGARDVVPIMALGMDMDEELVSLLVLSGLPNLDRYFIYGMTYGLTMIIKFLISVRTISFSLSSIGTTTSTSTSSKVRGTFGSNAKGSCLNVPNRGYQPLLESLKVLKKLNSN